jgi:hypothetical protein
VRSWWLKGRAAKLLYEQAAKEVQRAQRRNAQARKSHTKAKWRRLQSLGIRKKDLERSKWNTS